MINAILGSLESTEEATVSKLFSAMPWTTLQLAFCFQKFSASIITQWNMLNVRIIWWQERKKRVLLTLSIAVGTFHIFIVLSWLPLAINLLLDLQIKQKKRHYIITRVAQCRTRFFQTNHNGDAAKTSINKRLISYKSCNTVKWFSFSHCQNFHETESATQWKFQWNKNLKKIAVVVHVLQTTQNLIISRCCFAEDDKNMYQEL